MKKQHQYSLECDNGSIIWINYDPKKITPESDTRIIDSAKYRECPKCQKKGYYATKFVYVMACKFCKHTGGENTAKLHALSVGGSKWEEQAIKRLNK